MSKPPGKRLLNITSSGGAAIVAIDQAEKLGFETPPPAAALRERLRAILPAHCAVDNPIDLTGDVIGDPALYSKVMDEARVDYDAMVIIFGDPIAGASQIVTPGASEVVIFLGGADVERKERILIHERGIPVFPSPERGLKALHQFFRFDSRPMIPSSSHASTAGLQLLPAEEAVALLEKAGIPAVAALRAASPEEAVALARKFEAPVVLKVASPDIAHKSDVEGVRLNLSSDEEIRVAYGEIMAAASSRVPTARLEGVTVSPMAKSGGMEVIVGVFTDPQYGPTLVFGLGGIFTEIYRDVQFCLLPASEEELLQTIRAITGYPLLAGVRGQPPKDQAALVEIMKGVSQLTINNPEVDQIDLNPVLVYERGASIVDARIFRRIS
jgi:acyl-CoA synthetase (NDP forming)